MLVSIIIPFHNSSSFLSKAVESALNQTYSGIEIIFVDNNSTDNTYSILREYEKKYPDKIKLFNEPRRGSASARNKGIRESKGEWLQFLDSDDELLPKKIEAQIDLIKKHENNKFFIASNYSVNRGGKIFNKTATGNAWIDLIHSDLGSTCSNLFKKDHVVSIGYWDESRTSSQEYELMFRLLKSEIFPVYDINYNTMVYERVGSVCKPQSLNKKKEVLLNRLELRRDILEFLRNSNQLDDDIKKAYDRYVYKHLWWNRNLHPDVFRSRMKEESLSLSASYKIKRIASFVLNNFGKNYNK